MSKNDTISRIKKMPIVDFLRSLQLEPAERSGQQFFYFSPFRKENTPSFAVHPVKNCWFDHGADKGGDVIDLAMQLLEVDFQTAVQMLDQVSLNPQVNRAVADKQQESDRPRRAKAVKTTLQVNRVEEFKSSILLAYLMQRKINVNLLTASNQTLLYLKEVYYSVEGKDREYFALGWRNSAGDYELRSKKFQGFVGKTKTFTYIRGRVPGIAIFESFIDYFSALTYFNKPTLGYDILILNSTRLVKHTLELVMAQPELHFFLDNDAAGLTALRYYQKQCKGIPMHNHSHLYANYKDFNDKLTDTPPVKPLPNSNDTYSEISKTAKWWLWVAFDETDPETGKDKQCVFFSWNNKPEGFEQLLYLRAHDLRNPKVSRLCERTTGREYKVLEEAWH